MYSRRRRINNGSGSASTSTKNRPVASIPDDDSHDNQKEKEPVASSRNDKKGSNQQNPLPNREIRPRTSDDENNDPNVKDTSLDQSHSCAGSENDDRVINHRRNTGEDGRNHNMLEQYSQLNPNRDSNFTIYFVTVDSQTEATCSSRLTMAFQLCNEHNLAAEWISEKDCLEKTPKLGNIFVMDPFEGPVYEHLLGYFNNLKGGSRIIGPQCLRQAFERERQTQKAWEVPNRTYPIFTLGMSEVIITLSGFRDKERKERILDMIQKMAGFYTSSFTMAVTHVLAECVLSPKCTVAYKSGIPVMKADWVEAVWKESLNDISKATDAHFSRYFCPVFYNINICFSQIDAAKKESLKKIIDSNGGIYSPQLVKGKTQVLIIDKGAGEKFRYAKQWGVLCLRPDWITDSKRAGHVVPTDKYYVRYAGTAKDLASTQIDPRIDVPFADISVSAIVLDDVSHVSNSNQSNYSTKFRSQISDAVAVPVEPVHNELEAIMKGAGDNQYLDGCRIYLSGSAADTNYTQVRKLLNVCGATRLDRINENVSHVVVFGANLLEHEIQALKNLSPKPFVVTIGWIIASARKGELVDEEEFAFVDNTASTTKASVGEARNVALEKNNKTRTLSKAESSGNAPKSVSAVVVGEGFENEENEIDEIIPQEFGGVQEQVVGEGFDDNEDANFVDLAGVQHEVAPADESSATSGEKRKRTRSRCEEKSKEQTHSLQPPAIPNEDDYQDLNGPVTSSQCPSQSSTKIFVDYRFDVLLHSAEENTEVKDCIKSLGGIISKEADIVILPPVYAVERAKTTSQLFTKFWVFDCHEVKSPNIQMQFYHVPMKSFTGVRKIMPDIVIAVSGYPVCEKKYIEGVATAMGARFQDVFARKTSAKDNVFKSTHLICCVTDNVKYRAALKWNVPVIRHEWIIECFNQETKLDIGPFRLDCKTETNGSILMETPKSRNKAINLLPVTGLQPEKFKHPIAALKTPTVKRISLTSDDDDTLRPNKRSCDIDIKNHDASAEESPFFKGISRQASRQFKAALDRLTTDSPSPDMSSVRIRLPRNSTPEGDAYAALWNTLRQKFPGKPPEGTPK